MKLRFVRWHPNYCEEAAGALARDWDSSHDVTVLYPDGTRARAATFKHAVWAARFCEMMNAMQCAPKGDEG